MLDCAANGQPTARLDPQRRTVSREPEQRISMGQDKLIVRGAREHNLRNVSVELPRDKLIVITGVSGSGKSSLAFDTIYAEGQRRYVESLSAYARQFLGRMEKPDVDQIEGLSPAISIDQKGTSRNPRSTVGTVTEIYDYLRLLYARIGLPHCPQCGQPITQQTAQQIVDSVLAMPEGNRVHVLAPLIKDRKGEHRAVFDDIRKAGYVRVRVDGQVRDVDEDIALDRYKMHSIDAVVDRLIVGDGQRDEGLMTRLTDSVETALKLGGGVVVVSDVTDPEQPRDRLFSEQFACVLCGISLPDIEPRTFSFNSPHGACPACTGLGTQMEFDPELLFPEPRLSLAQGALRAPGWTQRRGDGQGYYAQILEAACQHYGVPFDAPWGELSPRQKETVLHGGRRGDKITAHYRTPDGREQVYQMAFEGVIPNLRRRYRETSSNYVRSELERFMSVRLCPVCEGKRLRPEALAVTVVGKSIYEATRMSVTQSLQWVETLQGIEGASSVGGATPSVAAPSVERPPSSPLTDREYAIARQVLKELHDRLQFMVNVGLDYLTLDRRAASLSGGEAQRIRLATQIGSQLMGVLYILDEPSIGLHQRDNARLIDTLHGMRDLGNTVLVVEHDEEMMRAADWIVDLGPGAGEQGGRVVCSGTLQDVRDCPDSVTGAFLRGERAIEVPAARRPGNGKYIVVKRAAENNLKQIDVRFPLGTFSCVTGVSGSGKSSLVIEVLYRALAQRMYQAKDPPGRHESVQGLDNLDKVINIDQSPIGRTPRSNPATYTNLFTHIRELFATLPESKMRGYRPGRFSFNVKGGRCEACRGDGTIRIEMQFMPDVWVPCEVCGGLRFNRETLQVRYRRHSIADVLEMTVDEALRFFQNIPRNRNKLQTLYDVGLGYVRLGQSATTLSGGEAQRVKLSRELSRRSTGRTLYLLDEPTTGLHFADTEKLLGVLSRLVDQGNTVIVIEHNLDVIKQADWVLDLGPEGGDGGGQVVAEGTPEQVAEVGRSYTGQYLRRVLRSGRAHAGEVGSVAEAYSGERWG
jgi:excinuclease ABC subunit A